MAAAAQIQGVIYYFDLGFSANLGPAAVIRCCDHEQTGGCDEQPCGQWLPPGLMAVAAAQIQGAIYHFKIAVALASRLGFKV